MPLRLPLALRQSIANLIITDAGANAILRLYTGTQPAGTGTAATGTLLSEHTCAATFGTVNGSGNLVANAIAADATANAGGTPGYARLFRSDGTTVVADFGSDNMTVNPATITVNEPVNITSLTVTIGGT